MKARATIAGLAAVGSLLVVATVSSPAEAGNGRGLAAVMLATAEYHRVERALASGRVDLELCFDQMGEHYADPASFADGVLDPRRPEALVYEHRGHRLRLVAVEWVSTTPGRVPGIGELHLNENLGVYVLHAWVWKYNPNGVFADFNPRVGDCPAPAAMTGDHTGH